MKPPICSICGKSELGNMHSNKGDWVRFQDYIQNRAESLSHPLSQPKGLEYFCGEHLSAAMKFTHMSSDEALKQLKTMYPCNTNEESKVSPKRSWWKFWVGI